MAAPAYFLILVIVFFCFFSKLCSSTLHLSADHGNNSPSDSDITKENVIQMSVAARQDENRSRAGFGVHLVRRDSAAVLQTEVPKAERLRRAIKRSRSRLNMFLSKTSRKLRDIDSPVHAGNGEFLMQIGIGTPPLKYDAIVDTGSDLIWTQCEPCENCYDQPGEIFDPSKSETYRKVACSSSFCRALPYSSCSSDCEYEYEYGDDSITTGVLASETFTLATTSGTDTAIPEVSFGCGHDNEGLGFEQAGGIIGLGRGPLSLISQLGSEVNNKFSYCLVSVDDLPSKTSPLLFGNAANLRGHGLKSTPLVISRDNPTFYYLTLQGVSVDGSLLNIPHGTFDLQEDGSGGFIIDSGTTITYLQDAAYSPLEKAVESKVTLTREDGSDIGLDLCYKLPSITSRVKLPKIVFHFAGGADYVLPTRNAFIVDEESKLLCLAFAGVSGISILGNIQQQNFHILYDLGMNKLSFVPTICDAL